MGHKLHEKLFKTFQESYVFLSATNWYRQEFHGILVSTYSKIEARDVLLQVDGSTVSLLTPAKYSDNVILFQCNWADEFVTKSGGRVDKESRGSSLLRSEMIELARREEAVPYYEVWWQSWQENKWLVLITKCDVRVGDIYQQYNIRCHITGDITSLDSAMLTDCFKCYSVILLSKLHSLNIIRIFSKFYEVSDKYDEIYIANNFITLVS